MRPRHGAQRLRRRQRGASRAQSRAPPTRTQTRPSPFHAPRAGPNPQDARLLGTETGLAGRELALSQGEAFVKAQIKADA